ncbi:hypothetical protein DYI95_009515 [Thermaerobacter sp. PB12/4term]|uniref:hypothetical protein n=1 Tax=Thermaerobacter sp. PB12/4term TaxID=2293838 RepID=UPI000E32C53B|nr:hypothetical protein [Thermaerobacter sp. PB12/4term]QIA27719.1 hypothetical protein DYI95_009515 [Thermaerobacter sp. PB12/4term]
MPVTQTGRRFVINEHLQAPVTDQVLLTPSPGTQIYLESLYFSGGSLGSRVTFLKLGSQTIFSNTLPVGTLAADEKFLAWTGPVTAPGTLTVSTEGDWVHLTITGFEAAPAGVNRVVNGCFDQDPPGSTPTGWTIEGDPSAVNVNTGGPCSNRNLLLGAIQGFPQHSETVSVFQTVGPLPTDQPFRLSFWTEGFNVLGGSGANGLNAGVHVYASDAGGTRLSLLDTFTLPPAGSTQWLYVEKEYSTVPTPFIQIQLFKEGNGFARFGDVEVVATSYF